MIKTIPTFNLPLSDGSSLKESDLLGKYTVLYFYPKDNTPGCTLEAQDFSALLKDFEDLDCSIVGVSADSPSKHCSFIEKKDLKITLLSDEDRSLIEALGIWQEKKMMGRVYMGIVRTTLLLDRENTIVQRWDNVRVKGHAQEVLSYLRDETLK